MMRTSAHAIYRGRVRCESLLSERNRAKDFPFSSEKIKRWLVTRRGSDTVRLAIGQRNGRRNEGSRESFLPLENEMKIVEIEIRRRQGK